jgi:hypothetical protein
MTEVGNETEDCYVFYMAPGAITGGPVEDKMLREHESEAKKRGARFYNYGWVLGRNRICSKTTHGYLTTCIDPTTMRVRHEWLRYRGT